METELQLPAGFRGFAFFRLALPMIISRAGLAAMGIADGIMVARFQSRDFAWLSLAEGTLGRLLDIFIAFLIGGLLLAPRHFARGDAHGARLIWRRTIPVSLALGLTGLIVGLCGKPLLELMGQKPELAAGAGPVMSILGAGYPAALLAISAAVYLEGINRPRVVAACVVAANLLNLLFNWLLIGGHWGIPAMGARGSALSTTIVRCALGIVLAAIAWRCATSNNPQSSESHAAERLESRRAQWKLSFGAAGSVAAMVLLGSSLTVFAGWLGLFPLATFSAAWGLAAPVALVALGMADASGIYVAAESGRGNERGTATVAWACLRLTLAPVGAIALVLASFAYVCAGLYARDPALRGSIASEIPLVALILGVDCIGFVMAACLRAVREAAWPAAIDIGAMLILVPLAASLTFGQRLGVRGLFLAMLAAGSARAAMLTARFGWRTRGVGLTQSVPA